MWKDTEDILFKKFVLLGAIDRFINLTEPKLSLLSIKKLNYVIGNPFETLTRTSSLSVAECLSSISKYLFLADFLDRFVGLTDAIYPTRSMEE